ncbi:MAG: hypothetical protein NTZ43_04120 [Gemmatimonadetes bacterium]|nr:hypothetical protein [Gemmatimonadota bacterium]
MTPNLGTPLLAGARVNPPRHTLAAAIRVALLGAVISVVVACSAPRAWRAPKADFLVSGGDSTYWVTSDSAGLKMRGAPLLLARVEGRFVEVFGVDDDHSYADAVYVGQRLFVRDLVRGDSVELMADTVVPRLARDYARAHPRELPLGPDEEGNPQPTISATADIEVLTVHGPYLSYEYHVDIDTLMGERHAAAHRVRRGVIDLRTASAVRVSALFGEGESQRVELEAVREWNARRDSLIGETRPDARRELSALVVDPSSFELRDRAREPEVMFSLPMETHTDLSPRAPTLAGRPVAPSLWWSAIREQLSTGPDSLRRWERPGFTVEVRAEGEHARVVLVGPARREFSAGLVATPVDRMQWLDASVNDEARRALRKAFADASLHSENSRVAAASARGAWIGARLAGAASVRLEFFGARPAAALKPRGLARIVVPRIRSGRRSRAGAPRVST